MTVRQLIDILMEQHVHARVYVEIHGTEIQVTGASEEVATPEDSHGRLVLKIGVRNEMLS